MESFEPGFTNIKALMHVFTCRPVFRKAFNVLKIEHSGARISPPLSMHKKKPVTGKQGTS